MALVFHRRELADLLSVPIPTEPAHIPGQIEREIRVGVDRKLARLFGAKLYLTFDWNIFSKPSYSLDQIREVLESAEIKNISAEEFVKDKLRVHESCRDYYFFEEIAENQENRLYRLRYKREMRGDSVIEAQCTQPSLEIIREKILNPDDIDSY
ncbi:hypothetical protein KY342_04245 [Candidatus Woesearchaeota archaeon]|nr:hypothetical protein [Candidatus Woesearchaeota archaeon]